MSFDFLKNNGIFFLYDICLTFYCIIYQYLVGSGRSYSCLVDNFFLCNCVFVKKYISRYV